jgi:hypothetical protein
VLLDTDTGPITGLAVAPGGFGDSGGSLFAAAGGAGLRRITTGETPEVSDFEPTRSYVDLVFSGTTLFALDADAGELVTVDGAGTPTFFQGGFDAPVGLGLDSGRQELLVADAGDRMLYAVPVAGGTPQPRAPYVYDTTPPSGIAYDDIGALAWVTSGSAVIRGSAVPRIDVDNTSFGSIIGTARAGFGDLELARDGSFLLVANDPDDDPASETDSVGNFLISVARDHSVASVLASAIGDPGELLLSLAYDPFTDTSYIGTADGNVYRRASDGKVDLLVAASSDAVLGLEIAPAGFGAFGGHLVATTEGGDVFAIDPAAPVRVDIVSEIPTTSGMPAPLSDLVFALDGTLYVLDNASTTDPGDPRVLIVAPDGNVDDLGANPGQLGQADGIEIDEGGERLLVVVSDDEGGDQLVAVSLEPALPGEVTPLADLSNVDDGYFPTGVVYDRLGTAVVREGDAFTRLGAYSALP